MTESPITRPRSPLVARLKVAYLLLVTGAAFAVPAIEAMRPARWYVVPGLLVLQVLLLVACRIGPRQILRSASRLKWLFVFLIACYVLLPAEEPSAAWRRYDWQLPGIGVTVPLNLTGLEQSVFMCLQILTVILASAVVRLTGSGTDLVDGLHGFGLPTLFVSSIDHTLALLGGLHRPGAGGGSGRGMGGGRRTGRRAEGDAGTGRRGGAGAGDERPQPAEEGPAGAGSPPPPPGREAAPGFFPVLGRLLRGDVGFFLEAIRGSIDRARERVLREAEGHHLDARRAHDVAVITGVALVMMSLKMLKFLPGVPFASGHKTLLLFPLYLLASSLTYSRWGGTAAGAVMGVLGFLQGDGRYGVLEILKHLVPGLVIDLSQPVVRRLPHSVLTFCLLGFVAAVARTSTELVTVLLLGARAEVYLFPAAKLVPNLIAGTLSGFVTYYVLPAFRTLQPGLQPPRESQAAPSPGPEVPAQPAGEPGCVSAGSPPRPLEDGQGREPSESGVPPAGAGQPAGGRGRGTGGGRGGGRGASPVASAPGGRGSGREDSPRESQQARDGSVQHQSSDPDAILSNLKESR
jgi:hypothetical protein